MTVFPGIPGGNTNDHADSPTLLIRLRDEDASKLRSAAAKIPENANSMYGNLVAYSKICTHAGCAISLYRSPLYPPTEPKPALRKLVANWVLGEVSAALNRSDTSLAEAPVSPSQLAGLLRRVEDQTLSGKMAKDVFDAMWAGEATGDDAADILIERRGLRMISDAATIDRLVLEVLAANAAIVAEFRAGKQKAFNSLVGQVMKASKGKANPAEVNAALLRKLAT